MKDKMGRGHTFEEAQKQPDGDHVRVVAGPSGTQRQGAPDECTAAHYYVSCVLILEGLSSTYRQTSG